MGDDIGDLYGESHRGLTYMGDYIGDCYSSSEGGY